MSKFNSPRGKVFIFEKFDFDIKTSKAIFNFRLDDYIFQEILIFKIPSKHKININIVKKALFPLHLALGTSYWKLSTPPKIIVKSGHLDNKQKKLWKEIWTKGLGEFFYRNKIDFRKLINFTIENQSINNKTCKINRNGNLLCLGGGKDSLTSAQILTDKKIKFTPLVFGNNSHAIRQAKKMKLRPVIIERKLDKKLFELNKTGKYFNGHVPFSLILAFSANLAAILGGYQNIIVSNEHSANYGNTKYLNTTINHQWSKSFEAEKIISKIINHNSGINYFSLMRPFWELKIVEIFVKQKKYLNNFTSCNKNFLQLETCKLQTCYWCCNCPKCAFAFSLFSAFLSRNKLISIFGKNMFTDKKMLSTFRELWGEINTKPFECVGEPKEVISALAMAIQIAEPAKNEIILSEFKKLFPNIKTELKKGQKLLNYYGNSNMPKEFNLILKNYL